MDELRVALVKIFLPSSSRYVDSLLVDNRLEEKESKILILYRNKSKT